MVATAPQIWLVGVGNLGQVMLSAWGKIPGLSLVAISPRLPTHLPSAALWADAAHLAALVNFPRPDALVMAVKPQQMAQILPLYRTYLKPETLLLSVAAGLSSASLAAQSGATALVRAMPNVAAVQGQSATTAWATPSTQAEQQNLAHQLLAALGPVTWLAEEAAIDIATALAGSGPAYVFALIEAMTTAGIALGLPAVQATQLARQTVQGAGALLAAQPDTSAAALRARVTSKGGTTEAALGVLQGADGLNPLLQQAMQAALARAQALARLP